MVGESPRPRVCPTARTLDDAVSGCVWRKHGCLLVRALSPSRPCHHALNTCQLGTSVWISVLHAGAGEPPDAAPPRPAATRGRFGRRSSGQGGCGCAGIQARYHRMRERSALMEAPPNPGAPSLRQECRIRGIHVGSKCLERASARAAAGQLPLLATQLRIHPGDPRSNQLNALLITRERR